MGFGVWVLSMACIAGEWSWGFREGIRVFEEAWGGFDSFCFVWLCFIHEGGNETGYNNYKLILTFC